MTSGQPSVGSTQAEALGVVWRLASGVWRLTGGAGS
jgi:hypothetical protein